MRRPIIYPSGKIIAHDNRYIHKRNLHLKIAVEYLNKRGKILNKNYSISKIGLVKHMAIAGQRYAPSSHKILKTIGMFFQFSYFLQSSFLKKNKFSLPPNNLYDPTEKGQFSNIAGKAIADFLAKKIDNAIYTVNYEAAMKIKNIPIIGSRPDLLAFTNNSTFAIEAKGYSKNSSGSMIKHKNQSKSGGILVNFTVASVSYNLYNQVKCKYYDPYNDNIPFDEELFAESTKKYYSGFIDFLEFGNYKEVEYKDEKFYEIDLLSPHFMNYDMFFRHFIMCDIFCHQLKIILPKNIEKYAKEGLNTDIKPFLYDGGEGIYIDNDRIGLKSNDV